MSSSGRCVVLWLAMALSCDSADPPDPVHDGVDTVDAGGCLEGSLQHDPCYSGPVGTVGVGSCVSGRTSECRDDRWVCLDEVLPAEEVCDGVDDDCDGEVDESPTQEVCDRVDNDCDGEVDEGVLNPCGTCSDCTLPGEHQAPIVECGHDGDAGVALADPDAGPTVECDLPQSECDGQWLIYWSNGVCVDGTCQWEQSQLYCNNGCYDGGCQEFFT